MWTQGDQPIMCDYIMCHIYVAIDASLYSAVFFPPPVIVAVYVLSDKLTNQPHKLSLNAFIVPSKHCSNFSILWCTAVGGLNHSASFYLIMQCPMTLLYMMSVRGLAHSSFLTKNNISSHAHAMTIAAFH